MIVYPKTLFLLFFVFSLKTDEGKLKYAQYSIKIASTIYELIMLNIFLINHFKIKNKPIL